MAAKERIQLSDHFTYGRLLRFTLPTISMMIFTSIYSVVDGFFVSNFAGKTPFAAVNLIYPFLMILSTVGLMFGTGGSAMVASAELLATPLAKIFVGYDAELMNITVFGFRIFALSFLFMGFAIYGSGFFTALNDGVTSAIISFLRTLVFQTAAVILLPKFLGIDGVWISIVVAEVMAVVFSAIFLITKRKKYHY